MDLAKLGRGLGVVTAHGIGLGKHQDHVGLAHIHVVDTGFDLAGIRVFLTVQVILVHADANGDLVAQREVIDNLRAGSGGTRHAQRGVAAQVLGIEPTIKDFGIGTGLGIGLRRIGGRGAIGCTAEVISHSAAGLSTHRPFEDTLRGHNALGYLVEVVLERVVIFAFSIRTGIDCRQSSTCRLVDTFLKIRYSLRVEGLPVTAAAIGGVAGRVGPPNFIRIRLSLFVHIEIVAQIRTTGLVSCLHEAETADQSVRVVAGHLVRKVIAVAHGVHPLLGFLDSSDFPFDDEVAVRQFLEVLTDFVLGIVNAVAPVHHDLVIHRGTHTVGLTEEVGPVVRSGGEDVVDIRQGQDVRYHLVGLGQSTVIRVPVSLERAVDVEIFDRIGSIAAIEQGGAHQVGDDADGAAVGVGPDAVEIRGKAAGEGLRDGVESAEHHGLGGRVVGEDEVRINRRRGIGAEEFVAGDQGQGRQARHQDMK